MSTTIFEAHGLISDTSMREAEALANAKRMEALSSPVRLRALCILMEGAGTISVTRLTELLGVPSQGGVSMHIQRLVFAGFLECMEIGVEHYYRVKYDAICDALDAVLSYISQAATG